MDGRMKKGIEENEMMAEDEGEDKRQTCVNRRRAKKT